MKKSDVMGRKTFSAGTLIFSEGDAGKEIYILNKGLIEVSSGGSVVAEISQRGVFFGEMAFILDEPRNATLRALTDCNCLVIYHHYIEAVIKTTPEIGFKLVKILARRLKFTTDSFSNIKKKMDSAAMGNAPAKPLAMLLSLGIISKEKLAEAQKSREIDGAKHSILFYLNAVISSEQQQDIVMFLRLYGKYKQT